jgi:curli biogenesis system outer membrane secretion channel CsgG
MRDANRCSFALTLFRGFETDFPMKRKLIAVICGITFLLSNQLRASDQGSGLPTVIVAPFTGDMTAIQYWQPALGQGLSEMFVTELGKINKFTVLENSQLGELKNEIGMGQDGWVDAAEKVDKGGFAAADFMFTAKVTRFGSKQTKVGLGGFVPGNFGNLGVKTSDNDVRIDWRLVDVATRKIIKTGSGTASEKGMGFDVGANIGGKGGKIGLDNKEFMESALGKATVKAMNLIITDVQTATLPESGRMKQKSAIAAKESAAADAIKRTPGKILAVASKDTIIVSLGSKLGFKEGDKLNLYETTEVKDDKGAVVFTDEKLVGEITLQSVKEDSSRASYSGDVAIKQGWTVKAK